MQFLSIQFIFLLMLLSTVHVCMYNIEQSAKHAELNDSTNAMTSMTIHTDP